MDDDTLFPSLSPTHHRPTPLLHSGARPFCSASFGRRALRNSRNTISTRKDTIHSKSRRPRSRPRCASRPICRRRCGVRAWDCRRTSRRWTTSAAISTRATCPSTRPAKTSRACPTHCKGINQYLSMLMSLIYLQRFVEAKNVGFLQQDPARVESRRHVAQGRQVRGRPHRLQSHHLQFQAQQVSRRNYSCTQSDMCVYSASMR